MATYRATPILLITISPMICPISPTPFLPILKCITFPTSPTHFFFIKNGNKIFGGSSVMGDDMTIISRPRIIGKALHRSQGKVKRREGEIYQV